MHDEVINFMLSNQLFIKQKQFLKHFVETTNVSPNTGISLHLTASLLYEIEYY